MSYRSYDELRRGLVLHLPFSEGAGTKVFDTSQYHNNGTFGAGAQAPTWVEGIEGRRALDFDSTNSQYVDLGVVDALDLKLGAITIIGWLFHRSIGSPVTIFPVGNQHAYHATGSGWEMGYNHRVNGINITIKDDAANVVNETLTFDIGNRPADLVGKWAHIAIIIDHINSGSGKVWSYINSIKQSAELDISAITGNVVATYGGPSEAVYIGSLVGWLLDGIVAEIRIYNRTLDAIEIRNLYNLRGLI